MLPPPATIVHRDWRTPEARAVAVAAPPAEQQPRRPLRLATWNIERGYELPRVIEVLKNIDADVLSLQELDIGCDRSGGVDTFAAIGEALGLNGLFLCEFEELRSPLRDARSQGGGVHGNAVFSKFDFAGWRVLEHSHHPIDWEAPTHPLAAKEPRKGRRTTLVADVAAPGGAVRVYCSHLEVFCGILGRVWQFSDILRDVKEAPKGVLRQPSPRSQQPGGRRRGEGQKQPQLEEGEVRRFAILGDLNTMANGVARLSPNYCCDKLRWATLGSSEAQYWQRHVLSHMGDDPSMVNPHFLRLGLPHDVCAALVNPGFFDPFDPATDITLDNPAYRLGPLHLMMGKLDWALLKGLAPVAWRMENLDFGASDHRALVVEAE